MSNISKDSIECEYQDYAFVHFDKREDALNAMRALDGKVNKYSLIDIQQFIFY